MKASELVLAAATLEIAAAETSQPRVSIVGYAGGLMRVGGWGLIAIDLSKLDLGGAQIPILADHDTSLNGVVGQGTAEVRDGKLFVTGSVSTSTEVANKVINLAKSGFQFQASVGVQPSETARVAPGQTVTLNGRTITAPDGGFTLIQSGKLREISVVVLGSDGDTSVQIAASQKGNRMEVELDEAKIRAQERERMEEIEILCGGSWASNSGDVMSLKARAIKGEITVEDLRAKVLELLRASRPNVPSAIIPDNRGASDAKVLTAAFFCRMGLERIGEKYLDANCMEQGRQLRGSHVLDLCRAALNAEGMVIPAGRVELIRAALSTISLPIALGDAAHKLLLEAYQESVPTWQSFVSIRPVSDFKTNTAIRPSLMGQLEQVPAGGAIKHATMGEATFPFKIDTFGKMLSLDRRDLINDDLGLFMDSARAMGLAARRKLSDLIYDILLTNAGSFFGSGNGNLLSGGSSALTPDGLAGAITLMASQRNEQGDDLDIKPVTLVVPPELSVTAQQILKSELVQRNPDQPMTNVLKGIVNLEIEPRLSNTIKFKTRASTKHWYLFGAPFTAPVVVGFLDGQQNPMVEFFGIESDPNRLAASWRVYHDFGAALGDPRAAVRSVGQ